MSLMRWTLVSVLLILNGSWVECTECNDGDYAPHPYDCNGFLQCQFGRWGQRNCASGLHFNPVISACDFPWNANCELQESTTTSTTTTPEDPSPPTGPPTGQPPTDPPTRPTTTTTTTTTPKPVSPPITTTTTSPPITTTTTSPPITTTTTSPPITTTTTSPSPTITTTTTPTTTTTTLPTHPPILECTPNDGPYVLHLPHPNCTMFYKCVHGIPHEMLCPFAQQWAMALDRCDSPSEANCVDRAAREQLNARPPNYW